MWIGLTKESEIVEIVAEVIEVFLRKIKLKSFDPFFYLQELIWAQNFH